MIITALASYYEQLLREHPDHVARPGWTTCKVKYQLVISEAGSRSRLFPPWRETALLESCRLR